MGPLTFYVAAKNAYLDGLLKSTTVISYQMNSASLYCQMYAPGGAAINSGTYGVNVGAVFQPPVAGVASFSFSWAPTTSGAQAATMRFYNFTPAYLIADGFVSTAGGGGNIILPNTTFTGTTAQTATGMFKVPLNNGGTLRFNQALANAWANTILTTTSLPSMANGGVLTLYNGTMPADADTAITTQTALASYTFANANFAAASSGQSALASAPTPTFIAGGTVTWGRWQRGGYVMDVSAGVAGADLILNTTNCVSGSPPTITSFTLTMP